MHKSFRHISGAATPLALAALSLAVVAGLALPMDAHASAFQLKEDSAKAMGRAYAGSATAGNDVSVVANSPAAMSDLKGTYFQADVTAINFSAKFSGSATDAQGRPISGSNGGDAGTTLPVPALFFETQLSDRWHVGASFTVPFGFQTEYDRDFVGRYNGIKSKFESLDATLSASFAVTDNFSVGASAIAQKTSAELTSQINYNGVGYQLGQQLGLIQPGQGNVPNALIDTLIPPGTEGTAKVKGDDWGWGWQLGGYWKLSPNDRFSLNYRSKISHKLNGTANFTVPDNVKSVMSLVGIDPTAADAPFQHTGGSANFTTPAVASASYWHQAEKFGVGIDLAWTKWDVFKNLTVDYSNPNQPATTEAFNWHNTWYASIGGDYYVTDKLTLRGGIAVDTTPTTAKNRDVRVPDSTRKMLSFGIGYQPTERFEIDASYAHIFVNKAHLDGSTSSTGDVVAGNFDDYGNLLSLSAQYHF